MTKKLIVLNSKINCTKYLTGTKNLRFYFELPPLNVSNSAKLKVVNFTQLDRLDD
jgi:hypothetical protein